jgi:diguanylate cyclase (GGDEF)-like protein
VLTADLTRIIAAFAFCFALFISDQITSVEVNEAQLYPLALICLYRVRTRYVLQICCAVAVLFTIIGYLADPPADIMDGLTNRTFSIVVILGTALCLNKLSEYERRLLVQSMTDSLTGLLNRRSFMDLSSKEETRARRHGDPFSVLMLDIDHFKKINDTHGHLAGDYALATLAGLVSQTIRQEDVFARYGGEEFAVILPQTDLDGAFHLGERIRHALEDLRVERLDGKGVVQVTVSAGVSAIPVNARDKSSLIAAADAALYQAKRSGKNRTARAAADRTPPVAGGYA